MLTQLQFLLAWLIPSAVLLSPHALAQDYGPRARPAVYAENGRSFQSGQSCSRLGVVDARRVWLAFIESDESGQEFLCSPERYYDCRDYVALVAPYLKLEWADNGYMCKVMRVK